MPATQAATAFFGLAAVTAVVDWWAVATHRRPVEYVAKPGVMAWLAFAALLLDPGAASATRWCFVVALVLSMAGDIFLMLRRERFVAGLASFLVAHVAYGVGMALAPTFRWVGLAVGAVVVLIPALSIGRPIAGRVRSGEPALLGPVLAYMGVITTMVALSIATGKALAIAGAWLFYLSDASLAWNRFVTRFRLAPLLVIITYHVGQGLLVLSLATM